MFTKRSYMLNLTVMKSIGFGNIMCNFSVKIYTKPWLISFKHSKRLVNFIYFIYLFVSRRRRKEGAKNTLSVIAWDAKILKCKRYTKTTWLTQLHACTTLQIKIKLMWYNEKVVKKRLTSRPTVSFSIQKTQFMFLKLSWNFGHK